MRFNISLLLTYLLLLLVTFGCHHHSAPKITKEKINNEFFFEETMILNTKCDNTVDGNLLIIKNIKGDSIFLNDIPECLYKSDYLKWVIGWGMDEKYNDNGSENLSKIIAIDSALNIIVVGKQIKGSKKPNIGQPVVFWNTRPSDFRNINREPITYQNSLPKSWKKKSLAICKVIFDSIQQNYIMILNQVDNDSLLVYALTSRNLIDWTPLNNGKHIYNSESFGWKNLKFGDKIYYSSFLTDIIKFKNEWYYAFTIINKSGIRNISIYKSDSLLSTNLSLVSENIISNRRNWKCCGAYMPKFALFKNKILLFYTGRNDIKDESVSFMISNDMKKWESIRKRIFLGDKGWRSDFRCSEIAKVDVKSDTIFLYAQGAKFPNIGFWKRFITKSEYKYLPGNILDSEIGMFISVDGGMTFKANSKNPILINDYSSPYEDDHLGMSLDIFKRNDTTFLFYTGKNIKDSIYQPFLKIRVKQYPLPY